MYLPAGQDINSTSFLHSQLARMEQNPAGTCLIRTAENDFSIKGKDVAAGLPFKIERIDQYPAGTCPIRIIVWIMRKGLRTTVPMVLTLFCFQPTALFLSLHFLCAKGP